jgi:hypothetical protein
VYESTDFVHGHFGNCSLIYFFSFSYCMQYSYVERASQRWLFNRDFTYVSHTGEDAAVSSFEAQSHVGVAARQLISVCVQTR